MNTDKIKGIKWLPFGLIFIGLIIKWVHIDEHGVLLNIGFIIFGLISLFNVLKVIRIRQYKKVNLEILRIVLLTIIILSGMDNLIRSYPVYTPLGIAILLDYIIGNRNIFLLGRQ